MEFHIRLPIAFVGGLIGSNGETVKTLRQESGCEIRISPREKTDLRKVTLSGTVVLGLQKLFELLAAQLDKALALNKQEAAENLEKGALSNMKEGQDFTFKVEVAPNQVGAVIGKGGEHVESLRLASDCQVKVEPHGEIEICGQLEHVHNAMGIIWESIKDTPRVLLPSAQYTNAHSKGPEVEVIIMIPSDSVGTLIGKKGEHITQIRRHCAGVRIFISNEEDAAPLQCVTNGNVQEFCLDKTMRKITLRGSMSATARCYQILTTYIV